MPRPSSISKLDERVRSEIGRLRMAGCTIDEIIAHMRTMQEDISVSRSAMGRHIQGLDAIGEEMRRARVVAEALVAKQGDGPQSQTAQVSIELVHGAVLKLFLRAAEGELLSKSGQAAVDGDPGGIMQLAKALDHLGKANKSNVEFVNLVEKRAAEKARTEAAKSVETTGRERGLSRETIEAIKAGIFGVVAEPKTIAGSVA